MRRAEYLIHLVADFYGMEVDEITGAGRNQEQVRARFACAHLMRDTGMSLPSIGDELNRDHSSIIYALNNAGTLPGFSEDMMRLRSMVDGQRHVIRNEAPAQVVEFTYSDNQSLCGMYWMRMV